MTDAEQAYAKAEQKIAKAIETGAGMLDFRGEDFRDLEALPPQIANARSVKWLDLTATQVSDLSPIAEMTGITELILIVTQVSDLSPIAGMTEMTTLILDGMQVSDLSHIAGMTGMTRLDLCDTQVNDLSHIAGMTGMETLYLHHTQVSDLSHIAGMTGMITLYLDGTQVTDLRPLLGMQKLVDAPELGGLTFRNTAACRLDAEIDRISKIKDKSERARALFDYLKDWVPPGEDDFKPNEKAPIPNRAPAPLEVDVTDEHVSAAKKDGLEKSDANDRAAMGWEALKEFREDFEADFNVSNYAPLPKRLAAFDRAMGDEYDPKNVVKIGVQAQRFLALAQDEGFCANLPDGAKGDLRELASEMLVYVNRFPDWVAYRDEQAEISAEELRTSEDDFYEIKGILESEDGVDRDVVEEFAAELEQAKAENAGDVEGTALFASSREVTRALAEHEAGKKRERKMRRDWAKRGGEAIDGMTAPLGIPFHLLLKMEAPLRRLADRFPERLGWVKDYYDLNFGPPEERDD